MQVEVYNLKGKATKQLEIRDDVFALPFNEAVVHQALVRQLANRRLGTADTKKRGEVRGSTRKLFAQKHTGRARRGDIRSPMLVGGGVAFGPHPRSYRQAMPRKMRRLALRCVLSAKAGSGELKIVDKLELDSPKTKAVLDMLIALGISDSAIIATAEAEANLIKSARNLMGVKTMLAPLLNIAELLSCKYIIMTVDAVRKVEELWGEKSVPEAVGSIS
ncbi:MAG: 50S ribosomal protein L4 [Chloroflexi bacterium RBG_19FT_COMBO_48_23]|nr:MAG: 50S ribosomal protein L4 [Chloroflexi bacterium RBG_19FT_COMBO_48_23]